VAATSALDEKQAELDWEVRAGRWAGAAAFAVIVGLVASLSYASKVPNAPTDKHNHVLTNKQLLLIHTHHKEMIVAGAIASVTTLFIIPVLLYLYRCTRFRRPELPVAAKWLSIVGPVLVAIVQILFVLKQVSIADDFAHGAVQTKKHADDVIKHGTEALYGALIAARASLALGLGLTALHAMRAGLLSRFMGILGIIVAVSWPLLALPPLQIFFFAGLGLLYLGRWPGYGRGPAWDAGEAIPWPSAAERAALARGDDGSDEADDDEPAAEPVAAAPSAERSPNARSRKRKKRR
jgi:hypothetical protein